MTPQQLDDAERSLRARKVERNDEFVAYSRSLLYARGSDHDARPLLSGYMFGRGASYEVRDFNALRDGGPAGLR